MTRTEIIHWLTISAACTVTLADQLELKLSTDAGRIPETGLFLFSSQ